MTHVNKEDTTKTHCGDTCDMSKSQVRHIRDPVSSIDRDRNYNISITMFSI